ncbi:glycine cleavage system H protein-like [Tubulanus polymorphus]|uniref:glycine cleavage system H protein-like n=1 Tax=Tubulanus polymorphus TaxID=672921 RepID=UPI003DA2217A
MAGVLRHACKTAFSGGLRSLNAVNTLPTKYRAIRCFSASIKLLSETRKDCQYSEHHEWIKATDQENVYAVGITDFAQGELGDVVYCELPAEGDSFEQGSEVGTIESVKAVSDLFTPVSGEIAEINNQIDGTPSLINKSPYDEGWLFKVKLEKSEELDSLMDEEKYKEFLKSID